MRRAEQEYYEEKEGGASSSRLIRQSEEEDNAERQKLMAEAERLSKLDKEDSDRESDSDGSSDR